MIASTIELICDICSDAADVSMYAYQGRRALRAEARLSGWRRIKRVGVLIDVCPLHSGEIDA